jgi:hypothetical protein
MRIQPNAVLHGVIWAYAALHLVVASQLPLTLYEAHYAVYAVSPQLSYLDHPPLAPWLQWLVLHFSTADFALRLMPIGLSVASAYLLAHLTRRVYPDGSAWLAPVAVLLLLGTVVYHASMTLSPDVPLVPLAILVALASLRCLENGSLGAWLVLGLAIGLCGLSKYTSVTLVVSIVLLVVARRGWRGLFQPGLWLSGALALALISPVLWWNWRHDWATVAFHSDYQFEDVAPWSIPAFLLSLAEQVVFYSPLLAIGGIGALWVRWRQKGRSLFAGREGVLVAFALPVLLAYLLTALESRASPHWSILGWLFLTPLLARWLLDVWSSRRGVRLLAWISGGYSLVVLLALLAVTLPVIGWPDFRYPLRQIVGWKAAAEHGEALLGTIEARGYPGDPVLLVRNWHHTGPMEWYLPGARVVNLKRDLNPYNLRNGYPDQNTWGVLVYPDLSFEPRLTRLARDFDCTPIDSQEARFHGSLAQVFFFYRCYSRLPAAPDG